MIRKPSLGESNLGAMVGAIVGAVGGLFAFGITLAIVYRDIAMIVGVRNLAMICLLIGGPTGWLIGGQLGPRLERWFGERNGEIVGGALGGVMPVACIVVWAWRMVHPG